jgi:DNA-binding transcriptional LysR family regulator
MAQNDIAFHSLCGWLKLRHLVLIDTLVRTQNMRIAAREMNLTQPALSKMLRDLETLLGFSLFERKPRSMIPTDLGTAVASYARAMLNDTEKFVMQINSLHQGGHGHLQIGAIFAATFSLLPQAIRQIKTRRPLLSIEVIEQTSDKLLGMLERKEIDLVIGRLQETRHQPLFDFVELAVESFVLVGHSTHPLAQKQKISADELRQWPWILYPTGTPIRDRIDRAFAEASLLPPEDRVETTSMPTFLRLLQNGQTIAVLPESMIQSPVNEGHLKKLTSDLSVEPLAYGLIYRKGESLPPTARLFADTLIEQNLP